MAEFTKIPMSEAQTLVLPPRRAVQEQYRQFIRQLDPDTAGRLELGEGDKSITERARLKAAAKAEGMNLHIQRQGDTIVFWETEEAPKARTNGRRKSAQSSKGR